MRCTPFANCGEHTTFKLLHPVPAGMADMHMSRNNAQTRPRSCSQHYNAGCSSMTNKLHMPNNDEMPTSSTSLVTMFHGAQRHHHGLDAALGPHPGVMPMKRPY